jgi:hypothetical protein
MARFEVKCPCCDEILVIDADRQSIVSHHKPKPKMDLDAFMAAEKAKPALLNARFEEASEKSKSRLADLEKRFEQNQKRGDLPDLPTKNWD